MKTHLSRSELSHHWTINTPTINLLWSTRMSSTLPDLYQLTYFTLKISPHPVAGSSSTPCQLLLHTLPVLNSAYSFKPQQAVPWGDETCLQTLWQDAGVLKQPCPAIYLLLTAPHHFCKSSFSQHFGPQPWTLWSASHGSRSIIPQIWDILSMSAPSQPAP